MKTFRKFEAIGTVAYVSVLQTNPELFTFSYGQMIEYNSRLERGDRFIYYDRIMSSWLPRARNDLIKQMRGDWIIMLDSDLSFPPDNIKRMLDIADKYQAPVLTGLYVGKRYPHMPTLFSWNAVRNTYENILKWPAETEIFQIDCAGCGCLFIRKFVFEMIWHQLNEGDPFDVIETMSEDFSFFTRLRKLGIGVYCAPQVKFSHLYIQGQDYDPNSFGSLPTRYYKR